MNRQKPSPDEGVLQTPNWPAGTDISMSRLALNLERPMSLQVELCEHLAQDCVHAAERTKDPQTRELLLRHAVQWMQDALAALSNRERRGVTFASAVAPSGRDLSPAPHGQRTSHTKRPLGFEIETGQPPAPPWLAARNKCLAQNNKSCTGSKPTKKWIRQGTGSTRG